jgi:UDP-N-acetylmuramoyl-tripeptide--D-alanyl-D-alanine ligase
LIIVGNTKLGLLKLAEYYKSLFKLKTVAVTGSAGKTSVKNAIASVLSQKYNTHKTDVNFNNEIGLPLTVFKISEANDAVVLEMGMNHLGEISNLSRSAKPDIALITNIGTAHIENLGSREGILKAKMEIAEGLSEEGILVLNADNDLLRTIKGDGRKHEIVWVSAVEKRDGFVYAENAGEDGIAICYGNRVVELPVRRLPPPLVMNTLMTVAVGFLCGLTDEQIKKGYNEIPVEKGRLEFINTKSGIVLIDDSYNANTSSMNLALDVLAEQGGETTAILGDMFELGEFSKECHEEVGEYAAEKGIDRLITIGKDARYIFDAFGGKKSDSQDSLYFETKEGFLNSDALRKLKAEKLTVLVKASNGMRFSEIVNRIKEL